MTIQRWYDDHVMPHLIKIACSQAAIADRRAQIVPLAKGRVFEIGCGGGINQPFYDRDKVDGFAGIDPSDKLLDFARREASNKGWNVDIRHGCGEDIPFDSEEFDTVVCTYTLCSVQDSCKVLSELRRILKPGGTLLFLEHGRAPDARVRNWQERIEPVWKKLLGGCHLTRSISASIATGGFVVTPIDQGYMPGMPKFAGWMEWGRAVKAD